MDAEPFPGWDKGSPDYQTICVHGLHSEFEDSSSYMRTCVEGRKGKKRGENKEKEEGREELNKGGRKGGEGGMGWLHVLYQPQDNGGYPFPKLSSFYDLFLGEKSEVFCAIKGKLF